MAKGAPTVELTIPKAHGGTVDVHFGSLDKEIGFRARKAADRVNAAAQASAKKDGDAEDGDGLAPHVGVAREFRLQLVPDRGGGGNGAAGGGERGRPALWAEASTLEASLVLSQDGKGRSRGAAAAAAGTAMSRRKKARAWDYWSGPVRAKELGVTAMCDGHV